MKDTNKKIINLIKEDNERISLRNKSDFYTINYYCVFDYFFMGIWLGLIIFSILLGFSNKYWWLVGTMAGFIITTVSIADMIFLKKEIKK